MIVAGLILTALLGWLLLPRRLETSPLEGLALGFALVAFGVSVEMFALGALGFLPPAWLALAPWALAAVWKLKSERPALDLHFHPAQLAALLGAAAALAVWAPYERAMPLSSQSWDAWAIWLFKAKAFFLDGGLGGYLSRTAEFVGQPGYPLLTPLYAAFLYNLAGAAADQSAKLLSPCFFLALLGAFHYVARRLANPLTAGLTTAMLALAAAPQRVAFELAGYADTTLSVYFVAAAGFLALWLRDGGRIHLVGASLAATAGAWTKNEGQLFLLAFGAIAAFGLLRKRSAWHDWAIVIAPAAVLLGVWSAVRASYGVEAAGFSLLVDFQGGLFATALRSMLRKAFSVSSFQLSYPLLVAGMVAAASLRAPLWAWTAPALALWQFAGALLAYATGRNEIQWWLETSADRLLVQTAPLALLTAAVAWGLWFESQPAKAAAPVAIPPESQPAKQAEKRKRRKR